MRMRGFWPVSLFYLHHLLEDQELPNEEVDPELFDGVKTHMVHGPCGSYNPRSQCMKNGICSKRFPKSFTTDTIKGGNALPHYGLPSPQASDGIGENLNREYSENRNFDPVELQNTINHNEPRLNDEQNQIYRLVIGFLNSIMVPGLPPYKLELKIGVPIILLRNLNPPNLCNGTRLRVVPLQRNVIEGRISPFPHPDIIRMRKR
ncbi:hypothetical protein EVAR_96404_1 [Eumeta japonica]|uniref:DNA helicase Pif1-like 2B domain-containing protein n=1 Tax=Eumeta variegata TaxID=151549 RepID=A0A4C1WAE9_EUMVA|nr:hypothetical protein EVAR_96404_1 [Eumeta japonica]